MECNLSATVGSDTTTVLPNGGGASSIEVNGSWRAQLHAAAPRATRLSLWSAAGHELLRSDRGGACSMRATCKDCGPLYLVEDRHPFFWPLHAEPKRVKTADGSEVRLRSLSAAPRVLLAERVVTDAELDAIRRLAAPRLKTSLTEQLGLFTTALLYPRRVVSTLVDWLSSRGRTRDTSVNIGAGTGAAPAAKRRFGEYRTSRSAWLGTVKVPLLGGAHGQASDAADARAVRAAVQRIASLVRKPTAHSEPLQVIHYNTSQYYYYHLDVDTTLQPLGEGGGRPNHRVITALLYLNDGFWGGHTNFPLAGRGAGGGEGDGGVGDSRGSKALKGSANGGGGKGGKGGGKGGKGGGGRLRTHSPKAIHEAILSEFGPCQTARGLSIRPRPGDVVLFYNTKPNSVEADYWPWHGSCEVTHGEKWAANLWFHATTPPAAMQ